MKIHISLPPELNPVTEALGAIYEQAITEVAAGSRMEYSAGRLSAAMELIDTLETAYARPREVTQHG